MRDVERGCRVFQKFNSLVSVIFLGIPLDRTGTVVAVFFLRWLTASADFERSSALRAADFGFLLRAKCLTG